VAPRAAGSSHRSEPVTALTRITVAPALVRFLAAQRVVTGAALATVYRLALRLPGDTFAAEGRREQRRYP
jgi:TPP-dependent trihydroxycyclohexane-1,2-dione (THcHDO) dehydratase